MISFSAHYHERTKYHPDTLASKSKGLDWSQQPIPFKEYKLGTEIDLKPYLQEEPIDEVSQWWQRLSLLLLCSYGLTAQIPTIGEPIYLRSAPSAGGLYPAEVYLIAHNHDILPSGIYNYQPKKHQLWRFWDSDSFSQIQLACGNHPALNNCDLLLITTAVFYRSSWRYQDRAYRRIFLDTGHLIGNIELAASMNGFRPYLIGGFNDRLINELLYLDVSQEAATTVIPLLDLQNNPIEIDYFPTALPSKTNNNYPTIKDGELLAYCHQSTTIEEIIIPTKNTPPTTDKYNFPFCLKIPTNSSPINWEDTEIGQTFLAGLETTMLKRRSTRSYTGADLTFEELKALLDFTYHPEHYIQQGLDGKPDYCDLDLISTFIAVSGVTGLDAGCYYYAVKAEELRQIRFKNFRQELHYLCLGQDLGKDAGVVLFHTANLAQAIERYGDRAYRYLHLDAGHLGQRLNLAAIHLGLGVSGIGGFFDDQVNEVLGIPVDEAVLYITTLGRPRTTS